MGETNAFLETKNYDFRAFKTDIRRDIKGIFSRKWSEMIIILFLESSKKLPKKVVKKSSPKVSPKGIKKPIKLVRFSKELYLFFLISSPKILIFDLGKEADKSPESHKYLTRIDFLENTTKIRQNRSMKQSPKGTKKIKINSRNKPNVKPKTNMRQNLQLVIFYFLDFYQQILKKLGTL